MATDLRYMSYGKLNLYLDVVGRRPDGYHDIETVFQTVSLGDELRVREHPSDILLTCSFSDLETGSGNLVVQAARLLQERTGCRLGARMHLEKRVPVAAGMAGGSGNAAAALVALNKLWSLGLSMGELQALGLELGSDVPYCLVGGTAAATQRGEAISPLPEAGSVWFVLVHPPIAVSASRVYQSGRLAYSQEQPVEGKTPAFRAAIDALAAADWEHVLFNRMEPAVFYDHPHLAEMRDQLLGAGCLAAAMSGSGPTLFGVCATKQEARRAAERFQGAPTSIVQPVHVGVEPL